MGQETVVASFSGDRYILSLSSDTLPLMTPLDVLQVLAAGIAPTLVGFFWYSPKLFGRAWMRFEGVTPEMTERALRLRHPFALLGVGAGVVTALITNLFFEALGILTWTDAVSLALLAWTGFVVPALLGQLLWEQKSFALLFINASYWLASLVLVACVLIL